MELFFHLSGFHRELARAEVISLAECEKAYDILESGEKFLIMKFDGNVEIFKRAALLHAAYTYYGKCRPHDILRTLSKCNINVEMPYRARIHWHNDTQIIDDVVDFVERKYRNPTVSLESPRTSIDIFFHKGNAYITTLLFTNKKEFMKHRPKNRPFARSISMDPRIARAMVNLSRIKKGSLLDPFCGTGGILMEAASMGIKAYGVEKDCRIARGAKRNMRFFGYDANIMCYDATKVDDLFGEEFFDSVVTDMPYGLSASLKGKSMETLYNTSMSAIEHVLKKNSYAVIMTPKEINLNTKMKLIETYEQRVHNTLTRKIWVFRK